MPRERWWWRSTSGSTKRWSNTATGGRQQIALTTDRPVGEVTREVLDAVRRLGGAIEIDPTPQEVTWSVPLDEDDQHARYDPAQVDSYFEAATQAALVLAAFRAPYRGRSTPVNAWWGSFDLATNLFSGTARRSPFRGLHHAQRDGRSGGRSGLVARRHPLREGGFLCLRAPRTRRLRHGIPLASGGALGPHTRGVHSGLGRRPLQSRSAWRSPRLRPFSIPPRVQVCAWDPELSASAEGNPPPVV